jgi:MFS family permease
LIFGTTAAGFILAALVVTAVREPSDGMGPPPSRPLLEHFRLAWRTVCDDRPFRQLVLTAMLFMATMMLFPHYQALGRERLGTPRTDLLYWLIAQNAGAGLFSVFAGTLSDRFGNRLAIRLAMVGAACTPLLALAIARGLVPGGRSVYWTAFFLLGVTPMSVRLLTNYTLELAPEHQHARYLGTLTLGMVVPILLSPLLGWLVDHIGFAPVFLAGSASIAAAALMTYRLPEPRHAPLATLPDAAE